MYITLLVHVEAKIPPKLHLPPMKTFQWSSLQNRIKCEWLSHWCGHLGLSLLNVSVKAGCHDKDVSSLPSDSALHNMGTGKRPKGKLLPEAQCLIKHGTEREGNMRSRSLLTFVTALEIK